MNVNKVPHVHLVVRYITWSERMLGTLSDKSMLRAMVRITGTTAAATVPLFFVFTNALSTASPLACLESSCTGSAYVVSFWRSGAAIQRRVLSMYMNFD